MLAGYIRKCPKTLYLLLSLCLLAISAWLFWPQIQSALAAMFMVLMGILMIIFAVVMGVVAFVRDPASLTSPPGKHDFQKPPSGISQPGNSAIHKKGFPVFVKRVAPMQ